jgi:hypothetical protein
MLTAQPDAICAMPENHPTRSQEDPKELAQSGLRELSGWLRRELTDLALRIERLVSIASQNGANHQN